VTQGQEDDWFDLQRLTRTFIKVYGDLSPDPAILDFTAEVKWAAAFLRLATQAISKDESLDHRSYTGKIRDMLEQHVHATGLSTTIRLRNITDPEFADDFAPRKRPSRSCRKRSCASPPSCAGQPANWWTRTLRNMAASPNGCWRSSAASRKASLPPPMACATSRG
jgi:hypothetical protein